MRIYSESNEENLRARKLLKEWADDGVLTEAQRQRLEQETPSELRTTNIFLRLVLFFFTVIITCAAVGLFFIGFLSRSSAQTDGVLLLIFAAVCYGAAEFAVSQAKFYSFGIEEALTVCSIGFLCGGLISSFFSTYYSSGARFLVPAAGAVFSLWIWHRFGHWYALLGAMIFAAVMTGSSALSHSAQHAIVAAIYAIGLLGIVAARARHRFDSLEDAYSVAEALLWLGIYVAINLKLSSLDIPYRWLDSSIRHTSEFGAPFYWTTWVMIWCLPPVILARGVRQRDRLVIGVGTIAALLTLVCNKPYLGWTRHTWDPMLLGLLLIGVAMFLRRWLGSGANGVRNGFTAERISGKDKHWMSVGSAVIGLMTPQPIAPRQPSSPEFRFGGGSSGGGGASSDF